MAFIEDRLATISDEIARLQSWLDETPRFSREHNAINLELTRLTDLRERMLTALEPTRT